MTYFAAYAFEKKALKELLKIADQMSGPSDETHDLHVIYERAMIKLHRLEHSIPYKLPRIRYDQNKYTKLVRLIRLSIKKIELYREVFKEEDKEEDKQ